MQLHQQIYRKTPSKTQHKSYGEMHCSIFDNPRIQLSIDQMDENLKLSYSLKQRKTQKQNRSTIAKQSFRSFVKSKRSFRPSRQREVFINLKKQMETMMQNLSEKCGQVSTASILALKQKIMVSFLNDFIEKTSHQNMDQAQLLILVWNNLFLLAEKSIQKLCYFSKLNERYNLVQQVDIHQKYQSALVKCTQQKQKMIEEDERKQKFMKIVVAKVRQYKKMIKKMEQTLRIAADKLNQFRKGYLQIQIECINLTMESKNIGEESAKQMVNRKMALIMEKSMEYKILPSKKKMKRQAREKHINYRSQQNECIKQQFYEAFKSNIKQKPQALAQIVGRAVQAILDKQPIQYVNNAIFNENLIQKYQEEATADKQTDMQGFNFETSQKKVGVSPQELFYYEMTKMRGVQTMIIQPPPAIKTQDIGLQCSFKTLKQSRLTMKKIIDISFLFQNTLKSSNFMRDQIFLKSSIFSQKQKIKRVQKQKQMSYRQLIELQSDEQQHELSIVSETDTIKKSQQRLSEKQNEQKTQTVDNRKKIRKLASTFNNKLPFAFNLPNQTQKYKHITYQDSIQNQAGIDESNDEIEFQQQANKINQPFVRTNKRIGSGKFSAQTNEERSKSKRRNESTTNANKLIQNNINNSQFIKPNVIKKSNKWMNKTKQEGPWIKQDNFKFTSPVVSKHKQMQITTNLINKQIDLVQLQQEIVEELFKQNQSLSQANKKPKTIKQLTKIIDSTFQLAARDYQQKCNVKSFLSYLYETVYNLFGVANSNIVKKKVVKTVLQIFQSRNESQMFILLLLMLGLDIKSGELTTYSSQNNVILIKLCKIVSVNWRFPLKISELILQNENIQQLIHLELVNCHFCQKFIQDLTISLNQNGSFKKNEKQTISILIPICLYLTDQQNRLIVTFEPIMSLFNQDSRSVFFKIVEFLLEIQSVSKSEKTFAKSLLHEARSNCFELTQKQFALLCCKAGILDFSKLFHRSLSRFKIKDSESLSKKLTVSKLRKMDLSTMPQQIITKIFENYQNLNDTNALFHATVKKNLLLLIYFKAVDMQVESITQELVGDFIYILSSVYGNSQN